MKKINEKLKTIALTFCVIYTFIGLLSQTIGIAYALDDLEIKRLVSRMVNYAIFNKINATDFQFENAVEDVVEDCKVYGSKIDC